MKPFKVGDYIIENDKACEGTVESIDIFYTKLKTVDNKQIVIPNGNITNNSITNLTSDGRRILDLNVGISYKQDIKVVKELLCKILDESEYKIAGTDVNVFVSSFGESAIIIGFRVWIKSGDYWKAKWEILETVKDEFDKNSIEIPYNQVEITVNNK